MTHTFQRIASGAAALYLSFVLMSEFGYALVWSTDSELLFMLVVGHLLIAMFVLPLDALAARMPSRPPWLTHVVLGVAALALAFATSAGTRATSDYLATRSWQTWGQREFPRIWNETYQARYWNAAIATVRRQAQLDALMPQPLHPALLLNRRNDDPTRFSPDRPPDTVTWRIDRVRSGRHAYDQVFIAVVSARWRSVPYQWQLALDTEAIEFRRDVIVRETLQWPGLRDDGWTIVDAEVRYF